MQHVDATKNGRVSSRIASKIGSEESQAVARLIFCGNLGANLLFLVQIAYCGTDSLAALQ